MGKRRKGLPFFGLASIDGAIRRMTMRLMDVAATELYMVTLILVGKE